MIGPIAIASAVLAALSDGSDRPPLAEALGDYQAVLADGDADALGRMVSQLLVVDKRGLAYISEHPDPFLPASTMVTGEAPGIWFPVRMELGILFERWTEHGNAKLGITCQINVNMVDERGKSDLRHHEYDRDEMKYDVDEGPLDLARMQPIVLRDASSSLTRLVDIVLEGIRRSIAKEDAVLGRLGIQRSNIEEDEP